MTRTPLSDRSEAQQLAAAEQVLGHNFTDRFVLRTAFTHASWTGWTENYERLEFLGDRVLGLVLTSHLFSRFPEADQGELTKRYHHLSNEAALAAICQALKIQDFIICDPAQTGLAMRASVQADVIEAVIAALYLDGGLEAARRFILSNWPIPDELPNELDSNPKSELQEWAASAKYDRPVYQLVGQTGSAHEPVFKMSVELSGLGICTGEGRTRKQAERDAARRFLLQYVHKTQGQQTS